MLPLGATQAQPTTPPAKTFGYAVVGIGGLSVSDILPAFAHTKHARLTGLVSGTPDKVKAIAAQYGVPDTGIYSYDTYDRIADNPDIDAVYIVLPNNMHADYTIRAHKAGKHVLVEKPMANTVKDCEAMIAAGKAANKHLAVAYRLRFEPYTQAMIKMVRDKELGKAKVILCEAGFNTRNPDQWRLKKAMGGGGSMMDIGIYSVNAARYLSGEEPTEVYGMEYSTPGDPRFKEVEETINFQMRFPSGVLANCVSSYGTNLNRFRVHAENGSFEMEPAYSRARAGHARLPRQHHRAAQPARARSLRGDDGPPRGVRGHQHAPDHRRRGWPQRHARHRGHLRVGEDESTGEVVGIQPPMMRASGISWRSPDPNVMSVTSPCRVAFIGSRASDTTGKPCSKRMRRRPAAPRSTSTVAVPLVPRRVTKASQGFGALSSA